MLFEFCSVSFIFRIFDEFLLLTETAVVKKEAGEKKKRTVGLRVILLLAIRSLFFSLYIHTSLA